MVTNLVRMVKCIDLQNTPIKYKVDREIVIDIPAFHSFLVHIDHTLTHSRAQSGSSERLKTR